MSQREGWIVSARARATVISPDRESVYSFDLEGRPLSWFERGRVYKRSLASEVHARERGGGRRRYRKLSPDEARERFARILRRIEIAPIEGLGEATTARLTDIVNWSPQRLLAERERFDAAYRPLSILPPDQYLSIVLQATFGCSWNRCSFCSFYADQPFGMRGPDEFRDHCLAVRELLGRGALLRQRIFLASGNAMMLSDQRVRRLMRLARELFPGRPISAFVDVFSGERRETAGWRALRDAGLERVHLGLESGHDGLLSWLNKPGSGEQARDLVGRLKRAGLKVAVILMVGVGGTRFAAEHVRQSLELVAGLPLERGDVVYLSPFLERPDSHYAQRCRSERIAPLEAEQLDHQYSVLREGIRRAHGEIAVARYEIREFVY